MKVWRVNKITFIMLLEENTTLKRSLPQTLSIDPFRVV